MAYTFGGATGDDANVVANVAAGADNHNGLVIGWFYPTTLTAGRTYWSVGTTAGTPPRLSIDTTTGELRLVSNNATTPGEWVTSGAGVVVNVWQCIAVAYSFSSTGPTAGWRVWVGDAVTPPRAVTVGAATVAPVGAFAGNSRRVWGNGGSNGAVALQGVLGAQSWINVGNVFAGSPTTIRTAGSIADVEAENIYSRLVFPWWSGRLDSLLLTAPVQATAWEFTHWDGNGERVLSPASGAVPTSVLAATINGATRNETTRPPVELAPDCLARGSVLHLRRAA